MTAKSTRRCLLVAALTLGMATIGSRHSRAADAPPRLFDAVDASRPGHVIGQMRLDGDDRLSVVAAQADGRSRLSRIAAEMNDKAVLHVDVTPPPGSRPYAHRTRPVRRGEPGFAEAQLRYIARYFDIALAAR